MIYTVTLEDLIISHTENRSCWNISDDPCSEEKIATLLKVCWFDIRACVAPAELRNSCYSVYLIFKLNSASRGLEKATASVRFVEDKASGGDDEGYTVFIAKPRDSGEDGLFPVKRCDGWLELKLGEFINNHGRRSNVDMRIFETSEHEKTGIVIKAIELRAHH